VMYGLNQRGKALNGARILAFGLTYKANTSDARESPAIHVIERLVKMGALVTSVDPHVEPGNRNVPVGVDHIKTADGVLGDFDCALMLTNHAQFDFHAIARGSDYVLDTRRCVPAGPNVEYL
jgi:UDP-N-acetyl-D-glucosamine dehydrogenase